MGTGDGAGDGVGDAAGLDPTDGRGAGATAPGEADCCPVSAVVIDLAGATIATLVASAYGDASMNSTAPTRNVTTMTIPSDARRV